MSENKKRTNLTLDAEIVRKLKNNHVNISSLVNELLKIYLSDQQVVVGRGEITKLGGEK